MSEKQFLNDFISAVEQDTPDVLDEILLGCEQIDCARRKGEFMNTLVFEESNKQNSRKRSSLIKYVSLAAAVCLITFGAFFAFDRYSVDTVIDLDVNPSIQLQVNKSERVLAATALNQDAKKILDGMELKHTTLNTAVNALIGSMLKHGFVSEIKNSVLISVEHSSREKGAELEKRLSEEVSKILDQNAVNGAVLTQTIPEDQALQKLAREHDISVGKAALVQELVKRNPSLTFDSVAKTPINDINLILESEQEKVSGVSSQGKASPAAYITQEQAKQAALQHAGVKQSDVTFQKVKMDLDDGIMVYDLEFYGKNCEYEYELDAKTGAVLEHEREEHATKAQPSPTNPNKSSTQASTQAQPATQISPEQAKQAALRHANKTGAEVTFLQTELERDDGTLIYDISFISGQTEYEYEIDAKTGSVLSYDTDYEHQGTEKHRQTTTAPAKKTAITAGQKDPTAVSADQAKTIALQHAKIKQADTTGLRALLDRDDGKTVYEVEFFHGDKEYDYEIDAASGKILHYDVESMHDNEHDD